jgi:hypothetical protein
MLLGVMEGGQVRASLAGPNMVWGVCAAGRFSDCDFGRGADEVLTQHPVPSGLEPAQ